MARYRRIFQWVVATLFVLSPHSAWSTTYYVAKSSDGGSSSNNCTQAQNPSTPRLTILGSTGGLACLTAGAGDTLQVKAGTYSEPITNEIPPGTAWGTTTETKLMAFPGHTVTLGGNGNTRPFNISGSTQKYIIVSGFIIDGDKTSACVDDTNATVGGAENTIRIQGGANHIRFENNIIRNSCGQGVSTQAGSDFHEFIGNEIYGHGRNLQYDHGMYISGADTLIERNHVHHNTFGFGIHIYYGLTPATANRNIVRYNVVHDNQKNGILIGSGVGNKAYNNISYDNGERGIQVGFAGTSGSQVYNNTVYGNGSTGIWIKSDAVGTLVKNNIFYANGAEEIKDDRTDTVKTNNRCDTSLTGCTDTANPNFLDAANGNFALAAGSPAIDTGTTSGLTGVLFNGGNPDQGAHETFSCYTPTTNTGKIENAATNVLVITCQNNVAPPLLPASLCGAGFTVRKNGSPNTVNSCTRTADNVYKLTLASSYASGDSPQWYYDTATGTITNSAKLGNISTQNQRLNNIGTSGIPIDALNQVGGGAAPVLTQAAFHFRCVGGDEDTPDCVYPINSNVTIPPSHSIVVRGLISNTVADVGSTTSFAVYAQKNGSGGYVQVPNGPCPSTGICFVTGTGILPPELVEGPTTEQLAGAGTFVAGGVQLSASETPDVVLTNGKDTELVAALSVGSGNVTGDYFDLRWYKAGGTPLTTYTQTARINVDVNGYILQIGAR